VSITSTLLFRIHATAMYLHPVGKKAAYPFG